MAASAPRSISGRERSSKAVRRMPSWFRESPWRRASIGRQRQAVEKPARGSEPVRPIGKLPRPFGPDQAEPFAERCQSLGRIVGPERQAVLGPRGEHPVRLGDPAGDEIVDHHAEIAVGPPDRDTLQSAGQPRRVQPGQQPLRRRLLVARGAVDLPGEKEPGDAAASPASAPVPGGRRGRIRWHSPAGESGPFSSPGMVAISASWTSSGREVEIPLG